MAPQLPATGVPITLTVKTTLSAFPTSTPTPSSLPTTESSSTISSTFSSSASLPPIPTITPQVEDTTVPTTSISVSDDAVSTALGNTGALREGGLSQGAVAAIVVVVVLVLAASALLLVRFFYKRSRASKRPISGMVESAVGVPSTSEKKQHPLWLKFRGNGQRGSGFTTVTSPMASTQQQMAMASSGGGIFPSQPYQPEQQAPIQPWPAKPLASAPTPGATSVMGPLTALYPQPGNGTPATVLKTYVPSLPDELAINAGERIIVIESFDDGWAQVRRSGAKDSGVVPLECLEIDSASIIQSGRSVIMSARY